MHRIFNQFSQRQEREERKRRSRDGKSIPFSVVCLFMLPHPPFFFFFTRHIHTELRLSSKTSSTVTHGLSHNHFYAHSSECISLPDWKIGSVYDTLRIEDVKWMKIIQSILQKLWMCSPLTLRLAFFSVWWKCFNLPSSHYHSFLTTDDRRESDFFLFSESHY